MFFLQIIQQGSPELVKRAFETSPDTVYGLLVAALLVAVVAMATAFVYQQRQMLDLCRDAAMGLQASADGLERIDSRLDEMERLVAIINAKMSKRDAS